MERPVVVGPAEKARDRRARRWAGRRGLQMVKLRAWLPRQECIYRLLDGAGRTVSGPTLVSIDEIERLLGIATDVAVMAVGVP